MFGGVNIGDRFRCWRDFVIRCEGRAAVGALAMCVNGEAATFLPTVEAFSKGPGLPAGSARVTNPTTSKHVLNPGPKKPSHLTSSGQKQTTGSRFDKFKQALTVGSRDRNKTRDAEARANGLGFVANTPSGFDVTSYVAPWLRAFPGTYHVLPALERLMGDTRYDEYVIAAAYLDTQGSRVLKLALDRGADVALVMPRVPNVYRDANAKALSGLMDLYGLDGKDSPSRDTTRDTNTPKDSEKQKPKGRLVAYVCDDMLHAKVFLARDSRGAVPDACMIGSCNLKQRSFFQFAELNALIVQPLVAKQLGNELVAIITGSERVVIGGPALAYKEPKATIEEWCG